MDGTWGLPADLIRVYEVAIGRATWQRADLVDAAVGMTGLSVRDVERVVEGLLEEGLLALGESTSDSVRVVSPGVGLGDRLARAHQDVASLQYHIDVGTAWMAEMQTRHEVAQEQQRMRVMERIVGIDAVRGRLEELAMDTQEELLSLVPSRALTPEAILQSRQLDEETLNRGVRVRTVFMASAARHRSASAYLRWLVDVGAEVKTVSELPLRLVISDRRTAILPIEPNSPREGALIVRASGLITSLLVLFDTTWRNAHEFGSSDPSSPVQDGSTVTQGLDEAGAAILRILATGATDDAVGNRLGMSERSVRRHVARLMADFDVTSRFALGFRLGTAGWDPDAGQGSRGRD